MYKKLSMKKYNKFIKYESFPHRRCFLLRRCPPPPVGQLLTCPSLPFSSSAIPQGSPRLCLADPIFDLSNRLMIKIATICRFKMLIHNKTFQTFNKIEKMSPCGAISFSSFSFREAIALMLRTSGTFKLIF